MMLNAKQRAEQQTLPSSAEQDALVLSYSFSCDHHLYYPLHYPVQFPYDKITFYPFYHLCLVVSLM